MNKIITIVIIIEVLLNTAASKKPKAEFGERVSIKIGGVPILIPDFKLGTPSVKRARELPSKS